MHDDLLPEWGLRPIELSDQPLFQTHLQTLRRPLSDYTFSQIFTWRNSLRLLWRLIDDHLCVFANGAGDLTLLLPPIAPSAGERCTSRAVNQAFDLMDQYNTQHRVLDRSRIEYVSEELLGSLGSANLRTQPMGHDYVYDTQRMIDLAGGDLKSKRQERGRFIRDNQFHVAAYESDLHLHDCLALLSRWKSHQDASHQAEPGLNATKRQSEALATELSLRHAPELKLRGMVVHVSGKLSGFTFGEALGADQASVVIEKTDLSIKGLAQFIFSEFCKTSWSNRARINAGDDWGLESLAWTKASYRPIEQMAKFVVRKEAAVQVASGFSAANSPLDQSSTVLIRAAAESDLDEAARLEQSCFDTFRLSRKQLRTFIRSERAIFFAAELNGSVVGTGVLLLRRQKTALNGRLYSIAVRSDQRGRGIGHQLLTALLGRCVSLGVRKVHLQVESTNASAIALYRKLDFAIVDTLSNYYGTSRDGIHMACDLKRSAATDRPALKPAA